MPADRYQVVEQQLQQAYRFTEEALAELAMERYAVPSRQALIGDDVEELFDWVRDETRWLPYQGALRGARGVLMDGHGSHLDRALLLAELLESAGYRVRLARATLDDGSIEALLGDWQSDVGHVSARPSLVAASSDYATAAQRLNADEGAVQRQVELSDERAERMAARVSDRTLEQANYLAGHLAGQLDLASADEGNSDEWRRAVADHWWVQWESPGGWQDLDPVSRRHRPGERVHEGEFESLWPEAIPEEQWHRLRFEVVAERLEAGKLEERTALDHEAAAAALIGRSLMLDLQPMGLPPAATLMGGDTGFSPDELPTLLGSSEEWLPLLLVDGEPVIQHSILHDGSLGDPESGTAISEAYSEATTALGQIGIGGRRGQQEAEAPPELTATFLRLSVSAPGRETDIFERSLMDVLGGERREVGVEDLSFSDAMREARAFSMLSSTELLAQSHWWPTEYTLGQLLLGTLDNRMVSLGAVHALRRDEASLMGQALERFEPHPVDLMALAHHRHARSPHRDHIALTRLNLLSTFEHLTLEEEGPLFEHGFDIIDNRIEVLPGSAGPRQVRLAQGVLDTVLEAELMRSTEERHLDSAEGSPVNASLALADALSHGIDWQLVTSGDALQSVDADTATHLRESLDRGQWLVMATKPEAVVTWWRIDPETGDTLGMGPQGRGQMTEQILVLMNSIDNAASAVAMVQSIWSCILTKPSAGSMQCCILREGAKAAGGKALGKLSDQWVEIASWAIESKIYLAALDSVFGEVNGAIVDTLPDPC
ncbi:hypothetical protein [Billgrantia montanilacus]|uniref:Uncharacterized protein n=1 Tax=Billgrantia montanilacus TaxID=2282305 RepID=A0A368TU92_9GAMM|nr:hypothetical protein [Halomonas montanilacus]RCV87622.1 hypothetical protein DU505_16300 [Halomonas montanilacus]